MSDAVVVVFRVERQGKEEERDIEVPLDITANELIAALNNAYRLGINTEDIKQCFLRCERPVMLLRGERKLRDFGVRNATLIHFTD